MTIENTLERIATALEKIAAGAATGIVADTAVVLAKAETAAKEVTDEIKEKQGAVRTDKKEEIIEEVIEHVKEETKTDAPEIKWADVNKAFFNALGKIKAAHGLDKAKEVSAKLSKKYSNGTPPKAENTNPAQYAEFLADIEKELGANV